jgi:uncharacterized protein (TIGR02246 family)
MRHAILVIVGVTLFAAVASMQTKAGTAADDQAIRQAWADYVTMWNKHDAAALASFYTDDVDRRTENGTVSNGRDAVMAAVGNTFRGTNKNAVLSMVQLDIRFLNRDVAVLDARDEMRGIEGATSVIKTNHTSVFVRRNGKWLTAAIRAWRLQG